MRNSSGSSYLGPQSPNSAGEMNPPMQPWLHAFLSTVHSPGLAHSRYSKSISWMSKQIDNHWSSVLGLSDFKPLWGPKQAYLLQKAFPNPGIKHAINSGHHWTPNHSFPFSKILQWKSTRDDPLLGLVLASCVGVLFLQGDHELLEGRTWASSFSSVLVWCLAQGQGPTVPWWLVIGQVLHSLDLAQF